MPNNNRPAPPSHKKIAQAQDMSAVKECWRCGRDCNPIKAHIIAHSHGGSNDPGNYFLLCPICHNEQPDGASSAVQWAWLRTGEASSTRDVRELGQLVEAMRLLGTDEDFFAYSDEMTNQEGWMESALEQMSILEAAGNKNARPNAIWGFVEGYYRWLKERK